MLKAKKITFSEQRLIFQLEKTPNSNDQLPSNKNHPFDMTPSSKAIEKGEEQTRNVIKFRDLPPDPPNPDAIIDELQKDDNSPEKNNFIKEDHREIRSVIKNAPPEIRKRLKEKKLKLSDYLKKEHPRLLEKFKEQYKKRASVKYLEKKRTEIFRKRKPPMDKNVQGPPSPEETATDEELKKIDQMIDLEMENLINQDQNILDEAGKLGVSEEELEKHSGQVYNGEYENFGKSLEPTLQKKAPPQDYEKFKKNLKLAQAVEQNPELSAMICAAQLKGSTSAEIEQLKKQYINSLPDNDPLKIAYFVSSSPAQETTQKELDSINKESTREGDQIKVKNISSIDANTMTADLTYHEITTRITVNEMENGTREIAIIDKNADEGIRKIIVNPGEKLADKLREQMELSEYDAYFTQILEKNHLESLAVYVNDELLQQLVSSFRLNQTADPLTKKNFFTNFVKLLPPENDPSLEKIAPSVDLSSTMGKMTWIKNILDSKNANAILALKNNLFQAVPTDIRALHANVTNAMNSGTTNNHAVS